MLTLCQEHRAFRERGKRIAAIDGTEKTGQPERRSLMVQVDVFWSYAIGAGFAASASRQLKEEYEHAKDMHWYQSKYFIYNVLFLACLFAPSGMYLLWDFPRWETMQVAVSHSSLPAWLVIAFAITNVTQGILGYWVAYHFIKKGRPFLAWLQMYIGYFCMFFILVYGWDGTGWQRFLYDSTMHSGIPWSRGTYDGVSFLSSHVAYTLYGMGIIIGPFLLIPVVKWIKEGAKAKAIAKAEG